MQFIDTLKLFARGGRGGDGCVSFRREKYVEFGGPNGGSGGVGGSVWLEADPGMTTLLDLAAHPHRRATDGEPGQGSDKTGACGEDLVVRVPAGTVVLKGGRLLADLTRAGERVVVARGGHAGRGNASFKTSSNTAPRIREKGEPGEDNEIDLELKLLADVGLVGFPNAGKSTLLAAVSRARPKIADYPFTTLSPNLGVVSHKGRSFVMADIPGLIEGAHDGKGLGDEFLRHIERTRLLIHLVDPFGFSGTGPLPSIRAIERELAGYSPALMAKPRVLAVTKQDLPGAEAAFNKVRVRRRSRKVFALSAPTGKGVAALLDAVVRALATAPAPELSLDLAEETPERSLRVEKEGGRYVVSGPAVQRFARMTDFSLRESRNRLHGILKKMGVVRRLVKLGVHPGDIVQVGEMEMEWLEDKEDVRPQTLARRRKSYKSERSLGLDETA